MYNKRMREYSIADNFILTINKLISPITELSPTNIKCNNYPAADIDEPNLNPTQLKNSIAMMRVDEAGEVCAQALYHGQSFVTKNQELKQHFKIAAKEEEDHLNWCAIRLKELGGKKSIFNPLWAAGSFAIGASAGLFGDEYSLGFLEETEYQVTEHLNKQLDNLAVKDHKTRKIIEQMRDDELKHAKDAKDRGAKQMPEFVKALMQKTAKIMTTTSSFI